MRQLFFNINKMSVQNIVSIITVVGAFVILIMLQLHEIPAANKDVLNIALGFVLGNGVSNVYGFLFGEKKNQPTKKEGE